MTEAAAGSLEIGELDRGNKQEMEISGYEIIAKSRLTSE